MRSAVSRILTAALLAAVVAGPSASQVPIPQRVVSLGVCADQLLLALGDADQIAMLSADATDPIVSFLADRAASFPRGDGGVEALVGYAPDLILADGTTPQSTVKLLETLGYPTVRLQTVTTIQEAEDQILLVGTVLGRDREARTLSDLINSARIQATRGNQGATVIAIRRGGVAPGAGTLINDLFAVAGLNNVADDLTGGDGRLSLEMLIAHPPDYLLVPEEEGFPLSSELAMLQHPALASAFPPARRLLMPDRLTNCGGPALPEALRRLANERARVAL